MGASASSLCHLGVLDLLLAYPNFEGLGFRVIGVHGFGLGLGVRDVGFGVYRAQGSGFGVQGLGFGILGSGFRTEAWGLRGVDRA